MWWLSLLATAWAGPHAEHVAAFGDAEDTHAPFVRGALPPPAGPATHRVYGYLAYWDDDLSQVPWSGLTDLAMFSVEASASGNLGSKTHWEATPQALALAAPYDVEIDLCVTQFDTATLRTLLGSSTARANLISQLKAEVTRLGADGVNIDFEGMPSDRRAEMVQFTKDLAAEVGKVVLAIPAVDWSNAWDLAALDDHADLFMMGYAYHYSGSSKAGPNDPLYDGTGVGSISLSRSVDTYLNKGVDPDRFILGLPLYGYRWPVASGNEAVGASTTGSGSAVFWSTTAAQEATGDVRWEPISHTPWMFHGNAQTWYANTRSLTDRVDYAIGRGLAGIGFWAINYDDGDQVLWDGIRDRTRAEVEEPGPDTDTTPDDTGEDGIPADTDAPLGLTLRVGDPLLVYPGDVAVLAAELDGAVADSWRWTQTEGPSVTLSDAPSANPRFLVPRAGSYAFEAAPVVDGTPIGRRTAWVVAVEPRGVRASGCAVGTAPRGPVGLGLASLMLTLGLTRRRRAR